MHLPGSQIEATVQQWLLPLAESLHLETLVLQRSGEEIPVGHRHVVDLVSGGRALGALAGTGGPKGHASQDELDERLRLVAEVFANALARQEAERALAAVQLEAARSREELARYNRLSTMGELTASLAHELRQPLSGILTNAQAALRFLQVEPPDLEELRLVMRDIVDDDHRAAAVIQRLRDLLTKREPARAPLDLNVVIRGVAGLLGSDAVLRQVHVSLELSPEPIAVSGDRIQLEQVVLNLMLNGMEAMVDCVHRERTLRVTTERVDSQARMAVVDHGSGLPGDAPEVFFEPFYTPSRAAWGWASPSRAPSWKATAAPSTRPATRPWGRPSTSPCRYIRVNDSAPAPPVANQSSVRREAVTRHA